MSLQQAAELAEGLRVLEEFGQRAELMDRDAIQAEVQSPLYLAGLWRQTGAPLVPAIGRYVALAAEDRSGNRGLWLRTLDRLGLGFDS